MPRIIISEPGKTPQPYRFKLELDDAVEIGRGGENDIIIECRSASSNHCDMKRVEGGYILQDKASTNGIKKDDSLMEVIDLIDGMEVLIGDVPVEFQLSEEEVDELKEEEFTPHEKKKLPLIEEQVEDGFEEEVVTPTHQQSSTPAEAPESIAPPPPSPYSYQPTVQHSGGGFKTLLVFVLVLVAVFAGMTLRHKMRTGDFLPSKILAGPSETSTEEEAEESGEKDPPAEEPEEETDSETPEVPSPQDPAPQTPMTQAPDPMQQAPVPPAPADPGVE